MSRMALLVRPEECFSTNNVDLFLERYRCDCCSQYLMYSPIVKMPSGLRLCGRCADKVPAITGTLQYDTEAMLKQFTFPCRNKQYGCNIRFPFGHGLEHEGMCIFSPAYGALMDCGICLPFRIDLSRDFVKRSVLSAPLDMLLDVYVYYAAAEKKLYYLIHKLPCICYYYVINLTDLGSYNRVVFSGNPQGAWDQSNYLAFTVDLNSFCEALLNPTIIELDIIVKKVI